MRASSSARNTAVPRRAAASNSRSGNPESILFLEAARRRNPARCFAFAAFFRILRDASVSQGGLKLSHKSLYIVSHETRHGVGYVSVPGGREDIGSRQAEPSICLGRPISDAHR